MHYFLSCQAKLLTQTQVQSADHAGASQDDTSVSTLEGVSDVWCYCRTGESGQMIQCESGQCEIDWFHTSCLKITVIPRGKWLGPDCTFAN